MSNTTATPKGRNPRIAQVELELLRRAYRLLATIAFDIDGVSWSRNRIEKLTFDLRDAIEDQEDRDLRADLERDREERQAPPPIASLAERLRAAPSATACACDADQVVAAEVSR